MQEVAAPGDPTQRFLQLQSGQGWAFDKATADRGFLMPTFMEWEGFCGGCWVPQCRESTGFNNYCKGSSLLES